MAEVQPSNVDLMQSNYSAGEVSPRLVGRLDFERYAHGAKVLENWRVLTEGGLTKRPGTRLVATLGGNHHPVLLSFIFRAADAMILEFSAQTMRAYKNSALVAGFSLATPYRGNEVFHVRMAQKNDLAYLTHIAHAPRQLERFADNVWTLAPVTFRPPPTSEAGLQPAATLTLSDTVGTSVTFDAASPVFLSSDVDRQITVPGGRAVIRSLFTLSVAIADILDPFPGVTFAAGDWSLDASPVANIHPSKSGPVGASITLSLRTSSFQNLLDDGGFDAGLGTWTDISVAPGTATVGAGVVTLNGGADPGFGWVQRVVSALTAGETYQVQWDAHTAPVALRIGSTSAGGDVQSDLYVAVGDARTATFVAQSTVYLQFLNGENSNAVLDNVQLRKHSATGWRTSDADGNHYVYLNGGLVRLTQYVSPIEITGEILAPLETEADVVAGGWTLETGVFTVNQGFPALAKFSDLRLLLASSPSFPQTIWGSATDDFPNFRRGTTAADGFAYTLAEPRGWLRWLQPAKQLLVGAESGEFRLIGPNDGAVTAAEPPQVDPFGTFGSAEVEPLFIGTSVLFAQLQGSKLRETTFTFDLGTQDAEDLSRLSGHLLEGARIVQMAYQQEPMATVWAVRSDGVLLGLTYDRKEGIKAWFRCVTPGGLFRSVACIPHPTRNETQVWVVVQRGGAYCVEVMDDTIQGMDSAISYVGPATTTLTGLAYFNGRTVAIAAILEGETTYSALPSQIVQAGMLTLPAPVTAASVGLGWTARLEKLAPDVPGRVALTLRPKQWRSVFLRVLNTGPGLWVNGQEVPLRVVGESMDTAPPLVTGLLGPVTNLGWSTDPALVVTHDQPLPCTLLSVGGTLDVGEV